MSTKKQSSLTSIRGGFTGHLRSMSPDRNGKVTFGTNRRLLKQLIQDEVKRELDKLNKDKS